MEKDLSFKKFLAYYLPLVIALLGWGINLKVDVTELQSQNKAFRDYNVRQIEINEKLLNSINNLNNTLIKLETEFRVTQKHKNPSTNGNKAI